MRRNLHPPRTVTEAWLRLGARRERRRRTQADLRASRRRLARELAPGRSFIDVGGMWGLAGELAFVAEEAGATRAHVFDGMSPSEEFARRHRERGSRVTYQQGDLHDPVDVAAAGRFDITWCTGVVYHSPDPYRQLLHLRSMTTERLLLGSHVVPEFPGVENMCVFYPGRTADQERAFARVHAGRAGDYPGAAAPFDDRPGMGYANMWWALTPSALRAMIRTAGFEILEEHRYSPLLLDVLARPAREPDYVPPLGASRARGRDALASMPAEQRPAWWFVPEAE